MLTVCQRFFLHGLRRSINVLRRACAHQRRSPLVQTESFTESPPLSTWFVLAVADQLAAAGFLFPVPSLGAHRPTSS